MFILNTLKVLRFSALVQMLILNDLQGLICLRSVEIRALALGGQALEQKTPARCWRYGDCAQCPILPSTYYTWKVTFCQGKGRSVSPGGGVAGSGRDAKKLKRLALRTPKARWTRRACGIGRGRRQSTRSQAHADGPQLLCRFGVRLCRCIRMNETPESS